MKLISTDNSYDFNYRPRSYWGPQDLETHYGSRAKGELRRRTGLGLLAEGISDAGILAPSLAEEERRAAGAIHPWFMGGEYLPDFLPTEVEIARVTLQSTTMDVISIRARHTKHRIKYRIVDEYEEDFCGEDRYTLKPKTSVRPLTLKALIDLIDISGLVDGPRDGNYENGMIAAEEIYDFATVSSAFYPALGVWFDQANEEWLCRENDKIEMQEREEA
jgi:hypothetical protein